jgi:hypothetical protein
MLLDEVVRGKDKYDQHYHAQTGKQDIHPILRQKIDRHVPMVFMTGLTFMMFIDMMMVRMLLCTAF